MSLREFDGPGGHRWKAWDVAAGQIHPKTRAEDYMRDLAEGWIVFERVDGVEKRRLCPYPADWQGWSDPEVAVLCDQAEVVKKRLTPPLGSWKIGDVPTGPTGTGNVSRTNPDADDRPHPDHGAGDGDRTARR